MEPSVGGIRVGVNVDIKRTDGRIHSAVVSGVNVDNKTVTVEWFEGGETKGKEIEIEAVVSLNPELSRNMPKDGVPSKVLPRPSVVVAASQSNKGSVRGKPPVLRVQTQNGHTDTKPPMLPPPAPAHITPMPNKAVVDLQKDSSVPALRRRSNVVKEVEKLKKNREERRTRQAEQKAQKQELMNLDPGNPNWEFLAMIREYRNSLDFRPINEADVIDDRQIFVCIRKRPLNKKEIARKEVDVVTAPNKDLVVVHEPKSKVDLTKYLDNQLFRFDCTFDESSTNELTYKFTAKPLVQTIFDGGMATCFAYGQTGSGKTHTMGGDFQGKSQDCTKGIYALAAKDVFRLLKSPRYRQLDLVVSASFFEIYSGKIFDLLNGKKKIRILEDGKQQTQLLGLMENVTECMEDVLALIQHGNNVRTSGVTSANQHSSRSHAVFQLLLRNRTTKRLHGKFSFIDLAGNERGADTISTNRQTRMEGAEINKSLLALKECIRALCRKGAHLPFRASKLTQVLRDSFLGENTRICMIATVSPGMSSCELTLNTLRYADRLKEYGAQDPAEVKSCPSEYEDGVQCMEIGSPVEDDLAKLRSMNEGELSADLYNLHEAVSHLQEIEEEVLDAHKNVQEAMSKWMDMGSSLLAMSNEVDYDVDAYVQQLEDLLAEKLEVLSKFKDKVSSFRGQLAEEEIISKNIKHPQFK